MKSAPFAKPYLMLTVGAAVSVLMLLASTLLALRAPCFYGIERSAESIHLWREAQRIEVLGIRTESGASYRFQPTDLLQSPDVFADYARFNAWFARQSRLLQAAQAPGAQWLTADGPMPIHQQSQRKLEDLPTRFWLANIAGPLAVMLGFWFAAFRQYGDLTTWLCINALAFCAVGNTHSIFNNRQLFLDSTLFQLVISVNHLAISGYGVSLLALLCRFPRHLLGQRSLWLSLIPFLLWLNETQQWIEWPVHTFFIYQVPVYLLGIGAALLQWRHARARPDDKAAMLWFFTSILLSVSIILGLTFLPILLGRTPIVDDGIAHGFGLMVYAGLLLAVMRYRLFDIERWGLNILVWYLASVALLVLDLFFVGMIGLSQLASLPLAAIVLFWLYLPLRGVLRRRLDPTAVDAPEHEVFTRLATALISDHSPGGVARSWREFLHEAFNPYQILSLPYPQSRPCIEDSGIALHCPIPAQARAVAVLLKQQGKRLFNKADVHKVSAMLEIAERIICQQEEKAAQLHSERERIAMDLHDDVAPQLLALMHTTEGRPRMLARSAFKLLRESVYSLQSSEPMSLVDSADSIHSDLDELCRSAGVQLEWHSGIDDYTRVLRRQAHTNLARICREAVTNAIRHSAVKTIRVEFHSIAERAEICVSHARPTRDAAPPEPESWVPGKGLINMRKRAAEIPATLAIFNDSGRLCVRLHINWHN